MISKNQFVDAIEAIKKQLEHDRNCADKLKDVYKDAFKANLLYDNSFLLDGLLKLLNVIFKDKSGWIEYFIYEMDFGSKDLGVWRGEIKVDLSDAGKLYDFLIEK
jgi:hypothetical protein